MKRVPVIRARSLAVLVSVSWLSVTGAAFAQDDAQRMAQVLCLGDPECEAIAAHRLTADNLRKMFAVDRELVRLMKEVPDLDRRMDEMATSIDRQGQLGKLTLSAEVHGRIPEIAEVLRRHRMSGRDYVLTHLVAMVTAMSDVALTRGTQRGEPNGTSAELVTQPLKFWRFMDRTLKDEADAWKKMRGYDQLAR